jgi:uncharacterized protein
LGDVDADTSLMLTAVRPIDSQPPDALPIGLELRRPNLGGSQGWVGGGDERTLLMWTPAAPELSSVANAVSLAMPSAEPYVVASVRAVLDQLPPELAVRAREYCAQEASHHVQHRRFNDSIRQVAPEVRFVEGFNQRVYKFLRTRSTMFGVAYAAGFEAIAYSIARWFDPRIERFFAGATEAPALLFLWHLAEEVEHKGIALDVYRAIGGKRRTYVKATAIALVLLAISTILGTVLGLFRQRRWWNPFSWARLVLWSISYLFVALPLLAVSATRDHHPRQLIDPVTLPWWLKRYDRSTGTLPHWLSIDSVS